MIARLEGVVGEIESSQMVLMVQGIGWGLSVSQPARYGRGDQVTLHIAWHWNQETGPHLFGFPTSEERDFFQLLTSCSGWGPKLALSLLQQTSAAECSAAIMLGDSSKLSSYKGIGTKKAESLIMQLRDKVDRVKLTATSPDGAAVHCMKDISDALVALRYSPVEVTSALEFLRTNHDIRSFSFDQGMRHALGFLAKMR